MFFPIVREFYVDGTDVLPSQQVIKDKPLRWWLNPKNVIFVGALTKYEDRIPGPGVHVMIYEARKVTVKFVQRWPETAREL